MSSAIKFFTAYRPPKKLRALFIAHYAPLLLIIMIGPISVYYKIWKLPINDFYSIIIGIFIFLLGTFVYSKWEIHWHKTYKGQLVTDGIFKTIRHPHYTSLLVIGYGLAFFFNSIATLIIAFIAIPIMIWSIYDEEKLLLNQYGKDYEKYMKKVKWRIIPGIF